MSLSVSPLVMWEVHGTDACVTAWVDVKLFEVARLPHLHHPVVTSCHQVLSVATQQDCLEREKNKEEKERLKEATRCWAVDNSALDFLRVNKDGVHA